MARLGEDIGVRKVKLTLTTLLLAMLAAPSLPSEACSPPPPSGRERAVGTCARARGVVFSLGLILVIVGGGGSSRATTSL
jgi:hypothetical protein